jgi:hypothetical protein
MTSLDLLIFSLAVWRVTSLLVSEEGPFDLLARFRHRVGIRLVLDEAGQVVVDERGEPYRTATNTVAKGLMCTWCTSVWVSALGYSAWLLWPELARDVSIALGASMATIIGGEALRRLQ